MKTQGNKNKRKNSDTKTSKGKKKKTYSAKDLAALCMKIADERKAENILQLAVSELSLVADYFIVCTGNSEPHIRAIIDHISKDVRKTTGIHHRAIEGKTTSQWIVIDFGTVIVHVMTQDMRELYQLENLWKDAPKTEIIKKLEEFK